MNPVPANEPLNDAKRAYKPNGKRKNAKPDIRPASLRPIPILTTNRTICSCSDSTTPWQLSTQAQSSPASGKKRNATARSLTPAMLRHKLRETDDEWHTAIVASIVAAFPSEVGNNWTERVKGSRHCRECGV